MDRSERFYRIDQLLHERGVVPRDVFLDELEVSLVQQLVDAIEAFGAIHFSAAGDRRRIRAASTTC